MPHISIGTDTCQHLHDAIIKKQINKGNIDEAFRLLNLVGIPDELVKYKKIKKKI